MQAFGLVRAKARARVTLCGEMNFSDWKEKKKGPRMYIMQNSSQGPAKYLAL